MSPHIIVQRAEIRSPRAPDLGLFSEEYDVEHRRPIGNFPQAFTHLTLVQAAKTLGSPAGDFAARYSQSQPARETPVSA
jgi:hypothetical protein